MRKTILSLGILACGLIVGCSSMTTAIDYDHTVDWSQFHTFLIADGTKAPTSFTQKRIENAITASLNNRGFRLVTSNPDLLVYPHVVLSQQRQWTAQSTGGYYGYGYRGWGAAGGVTTATETVIPIGTLIVDLVDSKTKDLIWRGTAQDEVSGNGEDRGKIQEATDKLFQNFPPISTGK